MSSSGSHLRSLVRVLHLPVLASALTVSLACGGGQETPDAGGPGAAPPAAGAPGAGAGGDFAPAQITQAMITQGQTLFTGQGTCFTCHGQDATGSQLAPNLTDQQWIHGDGSLPFIVNTIRTGVLQPQQFPGAMPPMGATLNDEQIRALAAYVYSRSHPDFRPSGE